jgi:DNA uptake protein ComE-like DNA-binding protein
MKKEMIKEHLQFNFKERIAFIIILIIIAFIFAYPFLFRNKDDQPLTIIKSSDKEQKEETVDTSQVNRYKFKNTSYHNYTEPKKNIRLFNFDPNTSTEEQWQELGLKDRIIHTIKNYLSKGGSFKKKEDLKKVYGLQEDEYTKLEPFIRIAVKEETKSYPNKYSPDQTHTKPVRKEKNLNIYDINTANSDAFIALPGIGDKLANRIINFRNKLGGFYSVEQVKETYALPDSTFQLIKQFLKLNSEVKKININTATKDDLKSHPYIKWNIANAIVEYRNQHGTFKSLEELKNIILIDEGIYKKIVPYLGL